MEIVQLQEATAKVLEEINSLLPQLRSDPARHRGTLEELERFVRDDHAVMFVAKDGDSIVGLASLFIIYNLAEVSGDIEDVVIDEKYRGQGLGERLVRALIEEARARGLYELYLTSRSSRVAANKLYEKIGFEKRGTNVYRLKL